MSGNKAKRKGKPISSRYILLSVSFQRVKDKERKGGCAEGAPSSESKPMRAMLGMGKNVKAVGFVVSLFSTYDRPDLF